MGQNVAKSIQIPSQGINIPTFDGAEDVLVVKFANKQDIKQWDIDFIQP